MQPQRFDLPADLPVPENDGAARHLAGARLPSIPLPATDGSAVDLSALTGRTVVLCLPAHRRSQDRRCLTVGTRFPVRAAAPRNPAAFAIISPT
jgi:hypothetical protein